LRRVTDLFAEGTVVELGTDDDGPVLLWINKLNPFEDEECRRDGMAARAERTLILENQETPDAKALHYHVEKLTKDDLIENLVNVHFDEDYMAALDDVELDPDWKDRMIFIRRMEQLHDDAGVPGEDERRQRYIHAKEEYFRASREFVQKRQEDRRREYANLSETELRETYLKDTIEKVGMQDYMAERRITEIFYSTRNCAGVKDEEAEGGWSHKACDHREKFLESRAEVKELPDGLVNKLQEALTQITVDRRTAGNLVAPTSSSESSGPQSSSEDSAPSIPVETPPVAAST
jgi:hypothetical protein